MVVRYLDFMGISVLPYEADAPLVVNSYAEFPSRSPDSFSNLFAGGILKSFKVLELLIMRSFLSAVCWMSCGSLLDPSRLYTFSVSLSLNDFIILLSYKDYTMARLTSSVIAQ